MATTISAIVVVLLAITGFAGVEAVNLLQDQYTILQAAATAWGSFNMSDTWTGYDCDANYDGVWCDSDGYVDTISLRLVPGSDGSISGFISEITGLSRLSFLDLSGNHGLASDISDVSALGSLQYLNLSETLNLAAFPTSVVLLTDLVFLDLAVNQITGSIPAAISNIQGLQWLDLGDNLMTGTIPGPLSTIVSLTHLSLNKNKFSGNLSPLRTLTDLTRLELQENIFTGALPRFFSNFGSLAHLDLSSNKLTGRIYNALSYLESLTFLSLANNYLYSNVPRVLNSLTNLVTLRLHSNFLYGNLPWFNIDSLTELDMHDNYLTGRLRRRNMLVQASNMSDNFFFGSGATYNSGSLICNPKELLLNCLAFPSAWATTCSSTPTQRSSDSCLSFCSTSTRQQCGGFGVCVPTRVAFNFNAHYFARWTPACVCYPGYTLSADNQMCV